MNADDDLERLLQLGQEAIRLREGPQWKRDPGEACEAYGEACENLWAELERQIEARASSDNPVPRPRIPPDPRKELKKLITARLKDELPSMVGSVIDNL